MTTLYTAHAHVTGGRDGAAKTDDGKLDVKLAPPKELGGNGAGTNPEQLFAAGYAACFRLGVVFNIALPGMDKAAAEALVAKAHEVCPYSRATRGNIDVTFHVNV